ncbi:MAG: BryB [uncultured bacterium]|nr:MAG: BryB [uncultured bacterium]HBG34499.1 hypothetical protein [Holosporales bacterium]HBW24201.1 hypothetical protein [Holosporales bacterium]HCC24658.1 hypothetical protein [Holosporales bacterium]HCE96114.1 hypothetical protein [Holosporales bacterium]
MKFARKIEEKFEYVPTLNNMGYMSPSLDPIQSLFVEMCRENSEGRFLDIGCGYGVATLPLINEGCHVIACDLDKRHLDVLKELIPQEKQSFVSLMRGHFPNEIHLPEESIDNVNLSMVLHFLPPPIIRKTFMSIFQSLKKGGKLFLTTSSPYQRTLAPFLPTYEKKRNIYEWPGYIADISEYVPHRAHFLPKMNIVFCINELKRLASKFGFYILEATFFSRAEIPSDLSLDGREYSGIICEKPRDSTIIFLEKKRETPPIQAANIR